jgi:hypothetical protein
MIKDGARQTLARIWHSGPHTGTQSRIQPHTIRSAPDRIHAGQGLFSLVVAGPGFEPG